jgi:DNA ligase (NAD+)
MDIEGMGPALVEQLVDRGLVKNPSDIYGLTQEALFGLDRMGAKSIEKLLNAISTSKKRTLGRLLFALGIRHVGNRTAELLAEYYRSMDALMGATTSELTTLQDIGEIVAESVLEFFRVQENIEMISRLSQAGVAMTDDKIDTSNDGPKPLAGFTFVVTGKLQSYSRDSIYERIKVLGGKTTGTVSKKTNYLVAGADAGSKLDEAASLGVEIISEDAFEDLVARRLGTSS